jgi:hypothetical protein
MLPAVRRLLEELQQYINLAAPLEASWRLVFAANVGTEYGDTQNEETGTLTSFSFAE